MLDGDSFRRLLHRSPAAAAAIVGFNWDPAAYVHPVLREHWLPEIPPLAWDDPRIASRLSGLLLSRAGLRTQIFIAAPNALWPLVLLPTDRLHRVAVHIGALILGARVRSSLARDHVLSWKNRLGEEAYRFAMNSASLLPAGKVPLSAMATESADEIGNSVIMTALSAAPEALRNRVALKFPKGCNAFDLEADKAAHLSLMIARVVEGEWFSSLAALRK